MIVTDTNGIPYWVPKGWPLLIVNGRPVPANRNRFGVVAIGGPPSIDAVKPVEGAE